MQTEIFCWQFMNFRCIYVKLIPSQSSNERLVLKTNHLVHKIKGIFYEYIPNIPSEDPSVVL